MLLLPLLLVRGKVNLIKPALPYRPSGYRCSKSSGGTSSATLLLLKAASSVLHPLIKSAVKSGPSTHENFEP